jgi:hypothetical protein
MLFRTTAIVRCEGLEPYKQQSPDISIGALYSNPPSPRTNFWMI